MDIEMVPLENFEHSHWVNFNEAIFMIHPHMIGWNQPFTVVKFWTDTKEVNLI